MYTTKRNGVGHYWTADEIAMQSMFETNAPALTDAFLAAFIAQHEASTAPVWEKIVSIARAELDCRADEGETVVRTTDYNGRADSLSARRDR